MLPRYTFTLVFCHRTGEYEEVTHTSVDAALEHLNMFTDEDGDIYESIVLIKRDWKVDRDTFIAQKIF